MMTTSSWLAGSTCAVLLLSGMSVPHAAAADETAPAEVIVLSTLHQLHEETTGYTYRDLSALIEYLDPDVLAVELTAEDLGSRREQRIKREYREAVFPLIDEHDYEVVPLEPDQPLYDEIVGLIRQSQNALTSDSPALAQSFSDYTDALYADLRARWTSACAVNSTTTDRLFESKHRFQAAMFGPLEAEGWRRWNQHFLDRILEAAGSNRGSRLLVLVGAEHAYWLREQLSGHDVVLPDLTEMLGCVPACARCEDEGGPIDPP